LDARLHLFDHKTLTWVFTGIEIPDSENLKYITLDFDRNILPQLLSELYRHNILSVIVEGGSELLNSFLESDLWDEAFVYTGNQFFGRGVAAPDISGDTLAIEMLDDCRLHVIRNKV